MINKIMIILVSILGIVSLLLGQSNLVSAQELNQEGDVIYLGTTITPTPAATGITSLGTPNEAVVYRFGGSWFTIPAGFFKDTPTLMTWILQIVLIISVLLVLFQLVLAGVNWITSGGDKAKTEGARSRIVAAIIGLVIVAASWAIFIFILQMIGIDPSTVIPLFG